MHGIMEGNSTRAGTRPPGHHDLAVLLAKPHTAHNLPAVVHVHAWLPSPHHYISIAGVALRTLCDYDQFRPDLDKRRLHLQLNVTSRPQGNQAAWPC
jgi:hypothetical protein